MQNKKDLQVMLKEAIVLFVITLIAGLVLGFAYELTKEPIRLQKEKAIQEACLTVFDNAASFVECEMILDEEVSEQLANNGVHIGVVYEAMDSSGKLLGYVLESTSKQGYKGNIVLYMGVTLDGVLNGVSIIEIHEDAGLGALAPKVLVPQFAGKKVDSFIYTKTGAVQDNEIDAISGATVTTKAVTNAVNGGLKAVQTLIGGGSNE